MEERKPWEQMEGESTRWFSRFDKFRCMNPWERSIAAVFHEENSKKLEKTRKKNDPDGTWYKFAVTWKWEERAAAYDKHRRDARDKRVAEKEADILDIEYAQKYERVKALDQQAHETEEPYLDSETGKTYHLCSNPERLREWRGLLDDIAKETNGRIKRQEITGKDGMPLIGSVGQYDPSSSKVVQLPRKQSLDEQKGGDANVSSEE